STLYRWIENGLFIPPIRLGGRSAVILESELDYFITETASGRQSIDVVKDIVKARTNKSSLA
ncbi:helix-turn-helix transcriptional regulator, partial [Vibrio breoganii]|uniref:helix-turn-helix transcriptional regulator n=1 Tax=Vibrio breoganii TaxID=553239 RepID=UPI001054E940